MQPLMLEPPAMLKLLAHELRWRLLQLLVHSDYRVHECVAALQAPMNVVSYHLRLLREAALVIERRSEADGRDVYYHLDLPALQTAYQSSAQALHPDLAPFANQATSQPYQLTKPVRILYVCTHNSARSQLAEAITRHFAGPQLDVVSAGTQPAEVHHLVLAALAEKKISSAGLYAKSLQPYLDQHFDYVITACDRAREQCPTIPGHPTSWHWSFADPLLKTSELAQAAAIDTTIQQLITRIRFLLTTIERQQHEGSK
ncbi:arsenate reductase/protein-tyrosine-phosphatase family protein [Herpetosiphon llansteffanensis]|uniref:arsenate reductase/protein-tyrosine-phosphatase family protein n=1 Tax=Herpetosiphon llansteffanensis TaxID=2094568 RepID=UPI000D7CEE91|nr:ArsR family transcriptional regulator [Herpetosiphon llansteffanensis]